MIRALNRGASRFLLRDTDLGWAKLKRAAKRMADRDSYVKVGVLGTAENERAQGDRPSNVALALIHEFGSPSQGIPERAWLRTALDERRPWYVTMLRELLRQVVDGKMTVERALGLVGAKAAADVKARLFRGPHLMPMLTVQTIQRKLERGAPLEVATRPLVETGQMVASVSWAVVMSGREQAPGQAA